MACLLQAFGNFFFWGSSTLKQNFAVWSLLSLKGGKQIRRSQTTCVIYSHFDGVQRPVVIPQRPARRSTFSCLLSQNTSKSFSPTFILNQATLVFLRNCKSLPTNTPDERISFNLMILIREIKEMSLIKSHYFEVGQFALEIFSFEGIHRKTTFVLTILS